jgi:pyridoxamine 5'-phosphate oxidase
MNFEDCVKFANENPVAYLATVDETGQPHVRAMRMWYADASGFYFQTASMRDMAGQLKRDPKLEICFFNNKQQGGVMLRVTGKAEFVDDQKLREKVIQYRPFLKAFGLTATAPELIVFKVAKGEAYVWTMETNLQPKQMIKFG